MRLSGCQQHRSLHGIDTSPHPNLSNCSSALSSVVFVIDALSNDFHTHHTQIFVRWQCGPFSGSSQQHSSTLTAGVGVTLQSSRGTRSVAQLVFLPLGWYRAAGVRLINPNWPLAAERRQEVRYLWSGGAINRPKSPSAALIYVGWPAFTRMSVHFCRCNFSSNFLN